jgi:radical SAM protein with 4Fe4S-binding SPASM domain
MGLFSDYCATDEQVKINSFEYNDHRYYLLPDHLEWYFQKKERPKKTVITPRNDKVLGYDFGATEFDQLLICVTNRCNIVCDYCFRGYNFSKIKEISFEDFKKVADHFDQKSTNQKTFQFTGGEVFVKEGIEHWFKYIHDKGFRVWLTSNGVHRKIRENKIIREVFENNKTSHIRISLDGPTAEIHERFRQKNTFDKVIENIRYLVSIGVPVSAKSVITRENIVHVEEMLELCHSLGMYGWNYNVVRYTGALADVPPPDSTPKTDEQIDYFGYYELGVRLTEILERKPHLAYLLRPSRYGKILNTLYSSFPMAVPMSYYVLKFDGNVYYNDNLHQPEFCAGNIWEQGTDAFRGLKEFRQQYDYDLNACRSCNIHRFCFQKGDYGELYDRDKTLQAEFPNCEDIRQHYYYLIDLKERGLRIANSINQ